MTIDPKERLPLLSFIYRVYTDDAFQSAFKSDPEQAMDQYKLTWDQKVAIYHSGAIPTYVTTKPVPGYPILIDGEKAAAGPNPLSADWWAAYSRFMAAKIAGVTAPPAPPSPHVNDRPEGDRASMAGVMSLLADELSLKQNWDFPW